VHQTGAAFATDEEHITTRGEKLYVQVIKSPLLDAAGRVAGTQGIFWDITQRVRLEKALRESEALYHSLVEALPCAVVRKDLAGRFTFANQRFCATLNRPPEQILGKTDFDIASPELAEKYRRDDQHVIESGQMIEVIEDVLFLAGKQHWHVLKGPVRDSDGTITGVQLIAWDITAGKLAEDSVACRPSTAVFP
jgi:PAS domain S-box-containing protein